MPLTVLAKAPTSLRTVKKIYRLAAGDVLELCDLEAEQIKAGNSEGAEHLFIVEDTTPSALGVTNPESAASVHSEKPKPSTKKVEPETKKPAPDIKVEVVESASTGSPVITEEVSLTLEPKSGRKSGSGFKKEG